LAVNPFGPIHKKVMLVVADVLPNSVTLPVAQLIPPDTAADAPGSVMFC
jgi:hypothetical protein